MTMSCKRIFENGSGQKKYLVNYCQDRKEFGMFLGTEPGCLESTEGGGKWILGGGIGRLVWSQF